MKQDTIKKILDYFYNNPLVKQEIEIALKEFFGFPENEEIKSVPAESEPYFNEWIVFEYKSKNRKTTLENYYNDNPDNLSETELRVYKDLQNNIYSIFEIGKIDLGKGLNLKDLRTDKEYYVHENKLTFQVKLSEIFFSRVAKIGGHYEIVGADTFGFDIKLSKEIRKFIREIKEELSPKIAFEMMMHAADLNSADFGHEPSLESLEVEIDKKLEKYDLKKHISVNTIKHWIIDLDYPKKEPAGLTAVSMIMGLIRENLTMEEMDDFFGLVLKLANHLPQRINKGKSPNELAKEGREPKLRFSKKPIGVGDFFKHYEKAMREMGKRNSKKALEEYHKCFESLYKQRTTHADVYRFYANTAIMSFAEGDEYAGKKLLEIALEINPNYDFGITVMKRYKGGEYDYDIKMGRLKKIGESLEKRREKTDKQKFKENPANIYYQYLKRFNINFKTDELTTSRITQVSPEGEVRIIEPMEQKIAMESKVGRNDPCPCGSGKKYKKCCGK